MGLIGKAGTLKINLQSALMKGNYIICGQMKSFNVNCLLDKNSTPRDDVKFVN